MSLFGKEKVVLALGGGGSRGLAHLGVLQVLEESDIPVHGLVGTSVGAIVGASYALRPDARFLTRVALEYLRSDRFMNDHFKRMMFGADEAEANFVQTIFAGIRKSLNFTGLIRRNAIFDGKRLREVVEELIEDRSFAQAEIPFAVPALDLKRPMEVLITSGQIRDAVTASCSLPGYLPPVELEGMHLVDVGVIGSVPVQAAREFINGALVVAVDLSMPLASVDTIELGWDIIMRVENFAASRHKEQELEQADVVIRPEIGSKYWSDFSELQHMVNCGREAALAVLPEIQNRLGGWRSLLPGRK